ncbi:MAG: tRNA-(ms[2]io[6]A)-hydroxylase [Saprospiraceae bacterium]|nr:tRNA-(ms[2]io[6]A)-hydroxylase [Saprospiraceae bacterium]
MEILDPKRSGSKTKLGLELPTDPRWAHVASMELEEILTDHAYCEQKAASACISLIQHYPEKAEMVNEVAPVVTEEWGHFRLVLAEIQKRGLRLGRQRKDEYVNKLLAFSKKSDNREERLIENLLTCALIEARSCERFRILSLEIEDEKLRDFYHHFMVSEAGHYKMFLRLAKLYGGDEKVSRRWQEYLDFEAEMVRALPLRGDRMH